MESMLGRKEGLTSRGAASACAYCQIVRTARLRSLIVIVIGTSTADAARLDDAHLGDIGVSTACAARSSPRARRGRWPGQDSNLRATDYEGQQ
jgi:hypothetical protein